MSQQERARQLAERLLELADVVGRKEGADLVHVSTAEICKAMGKPGGASLEEVREFVRLVLPHLQGCGATAACGCGLLSLQVGESGLLDRAVTEGRDLSVFTPEDIDSYLAGASREDCRRR